MSLRGLLVSVLLLTLVAGTAPAAEPDLARKVRDAALVTYVHGMTDEIAAREVGPEGIPYLIELLRDPEFPRRDNVVAFLAHLAGDEATAALLAHVDRPAAALSTPEEERAMWLVPQALGHIAARGGEQALDALQRMTASPRVRGELRRQTQYGLEIARGGEKVEGSAPIDAQFDSAGGGAVTLHLIDTAPTGHDSPLTYANHVDVSNPMNDLQLDWNLDRASSAAGEVDFAADVGCCIRLSRSGSAGTFGLSGDGRDTIDSESELLSVLGNSVSRVKVVNLINYCGGPGTNIIGCAYRPGNAMVVVRRTSNEGLLWLHEYGHNAGLEHNDDDRYVMYPQLSPGVRALTAAECAAYHAPPPATEMTPLAIGVCHDDDADDLVSTADNCPDDYNPTQSDQDSDGQGDVCDSGCEDLDSDGYGDPGDPLCPAGSAEDCDDGDPDVNPSAREICDSIDNNCDGSFDDVTCDQLEATGDTTVDGLELAWLGWAFTLCSVPPHNEWWLPIDYTGDGCVDGDDLAILATAYDCSGTEPVCE